MRRGGAGVHGARLHVLEAAGEIVVPAAIVVVAPVVVAQFAHQGHLQPPRRLRLPLGVHPHQLEARVGIGAGAVLRVEQRAHADQRRRRPQHPLQVAVDRASAALVDAAGDGHPHGGVRLGRFLGQFQHGLDPALGVERGVQHFARLLRQLHGRIAEGVAGQAFQRLARHRQRHLRGEAVAGGGRAVQVGCLGLQLQRLAGPERGLRVRRGQLQLHPFREEFLDPQDHALHRLPGGRIDAELGLPTPGRRVGGDLLFEGVMTLRARLQPGLAEDAPVRLLQAQEQRLRLRVLAAGQRPAVEVAQQRRQAHGLARPVQVATGPGEHVEGGLGASAHREFGQVQRRLVERQQRHVLAAPRHQHLRGVHAVVQQRVAIAVGGRLQQRLALGIEHAQFHPLERRAVVQRSGVHVQGVAIGARVQADVADAEERRVELAGELADPAQHGEIQPRLLQLGNVLDRQVVEHPLVALAAEQEAVEVDRIGQVAQRRVVAVVAVQLPAAAASAALELGEEARQLALAHAQELHVHFRHVHRHHRQAAAVARRQHAALRGEAGHRIQFAGMHDLGQFPRQAAAVGGEQAGGHGHGVIARRLDVGIAQDGAVVGQRPAALAGAGRLDLQQRIEILGTDQRPGKLQCQGQAAVFLVRPGPHQGEAFDRGAGGLQLLAAGLRQLPAGVASAAAQQQSRQHQQRQQHATRPTRAPCHPPVPRPAPLHALALRAALSAV